MIYPVYVVYLYKVLFALIKILFTKISHGPIVTRMYDIMSMLPKNNDLRINKAAI